MVCFQNYKKGWVRQTSPYYEFLETSGIRAEKQKVHTIYTSYKYVHCAYSIRNAHRPSEYIIASKE